MKAAWRTILLLLLLAPPFAVPPVRAGKPSAQAAATLAPIDSLWSNRRHDEALAELRRALDEARATNDSTLLAHLLWRQGNFLITSGKIPQARQPLLEAVRLSDALEDTSALCPSLRWLALTDPGAGGPEATRRVLDRLVATAAACGDRRHQGWGHVGLAYQAWVAGNMTEALDHYQAAADLFQPTGDIEGTIWANNGIAMIRSTQGEYQKTLDSYRRNAAEAARHGLSAAQAVALNNLGTLEYSLGRTDQALADFQASLDLARRTGRLQAMPSPLRNIALCQLQQGKSEAARASLEEALHVSREVGYQVLIDGCRLELALLLATTGHHQESASRFKTILADSARMEFKNRVDAHLGLGSLYMETGDFSLSLEQLRQAESLLAGGQDQYRLLQARGRQGNVLVDMGRFEAALEILLPTVEYARKSGITEFVVDGLYHIGRCHLQTGNPDSARFYLEAAAEAWDHERRLLLDPRWREQHGRRGKRLFSKLIPLLWTTGKQREAWHYLQVFKGRTLLERMLGPGRAFNEAVAGGTPATVGLDSLRHHVMEEGELLLDFMVGFDQAFVIAVSRDTLALAILPDGRNLESEIHSYYTLLSDPRAGSPATLATVGNRMAHRILGSLADLAIRSRRILVCWDGALNLTPDCLLQSGTLRAEPPVPVGRIPSATILARLRGSRKNNTVAGAWNILALAGDGKTEAVALAGAEREIAWLTETFHGVEIPSSPRDGDRPGADLPAGGYEILHLAAHARNNDQNPWQSAVVTNVGTESGCWRAEQIAGTRLEARLAVLSSCSTATGKIISGEGVMGLTAAFISAGVPAVVASLWPVDDAVTLEFMQEFYLAMAAGEDITGALDRARVVIGSRPETAHPFFWAGFVVTGEGDLHPRLQRKNPLTGPALAVLLAGLAVAILVGKRRSRP